MRTRLLGVGALAALGLSTALSHDSRADAYGYGYGAPPPAPAQEFWEEVVQPHGQQIQIILTNAANVWNQLYQMAQYDQQDATGEVRTRALDDIWGQLRYARKLDPTRKDVLEWIGKFGEEFGRTSGAIEALEAYVSLLGPDDEIPQEIHLRLGRAYTRTGRLEDGIRHLRAAISTTTTGMSATAALALALMESGRTADAVDLVPQEQSPQQYYYGYGNEQMQLAFTRAVVLDRDEQISRAFDIIEDLKNQLQTEYINRLMPALASMPLGAPHDRHYFLGLLYESEGYLAEARTEWLHYAQSEGPFAARARDHVAAIDQLLAARLAEAAKPKKPAAAGVTIQPPPPPYP
jgi:hypothetical protein